MNKILSFSEFGGIASMMGIVYSAGKFDPEGWFLAVVALVVCIYFDF